MIYYSLKTPEKRNPRCKLYSIITGIPSLKGRYIESGFLAGYLSFSNGTTSAGHKPNPLQITAKMLKDLNMCIHPGCQWQIFRSCFAGRNASLNILVEGLASILGPRGGVNSNHKQSLLGNDPTSKGTQLKLNRSIFFNLVGQFGPSWSVKGRTRRTSSESPCVFARNTKQDFFEQKFCQQKLLAAVCFGNSSCKCLKYLYIYTIYIQGTFSHHRISQVV